MRYATPLTICVLLTACTGKGSPHPDDVAATEAKPAELEEDRATPDERETPDEDPWENLRLEPDPTPFIGTRPPGSIPLPKQHPAQSPSGDRPSVFRRRSIPEAEGPYSWHIEAGGRRLAAPVGDRCGVWEMDSEGSVASLSGGGDAGPCQNWGALEILAWVDENTVVTRGGAGIGAGIKDATGGETGGDPKGQLELEAGRFALPGTSLEAEAGAGRRYRAAAFSRDGSRLAVLVSTANAGFVEIWAVDEARLERTLSLDIKPASGPEGGDGARAGRHIEEAWIHWRPESLAVVVEVEVSEDGTVLALPFAYVWTSLDEGAERVAFVEMGTEFFSEVLQIWIDPERRNLFVQTSGVIPDDGRDLVQIPGISLVTGEALGVVEGAQFFSEQDSSDGPEFEWSDAVGVNLWRIEGTGYGYEEDLSWSWELVSMMPLPNASVEFSHRRGSVPALQVADELSLGLVGRGRVLSEYLLCPSPKAEGEGEGEGCESVETVPEGCTLIDADWHLNELLLTCGDRWLVVDMPVFGAAIDLGDASEVGRGTDAPLDALWGGGRGMALWTAEGGLRLIPADGDEVTIETANILHRAILDEEVGLILFTDEAAGELRVVSQEDGKIGPALAWTGKVELAAFSPRGGSVAIYGDGILALFRIDRAEPSLVWTAGSLRGIAFRQDGEVLYVGKRRPLPELALDLDTGELAAGEQLDARTLGRLAEADMDPTWRWAIEADGTLLRTFDGQGLLVYEDGLALADSGWFEGDPAELERYRVQGSASKLKPSRSLRSLSRQLRRRGLSAEFFNGRSLPAPKLGRVRAEKNRG